MPTVTTHPTPNPNSLKFTMDGERFVDSGLFAYGAAAEAEGDPLASALFAVRGVVNVLIVPDFVTVSKHPAASWDQLVPSIERILGERSASAQAE
ncbi:MAG: NifU N-terminal domain-containing protein [Rubricoccaceae bacterium]|nr:NifU N-terminal domain-containing protein [Rubricoccaceae bacterium]